MNCFNERLKRVLFAGLQISFDRALIGSRHRWAVGDDNSCHRWMVHAKRNIWRLFLQNSLLGLWMCPLCGPRISRVIQFYLQRCPSGLLSIIISSLFSHYLARRDMFFFGSILNLAYLMRASEW
jgi:hypothetical protein